MKTTIALIMSIIKGKVLIFWSDFVLPIQKEKLNQIININWFIKIINQMDYCDTQENNDI